MICPSCFTDEDHFIAARAGDLSGPLSNRNCWPQRLGDPGALNPPAAVLESRLFFPPANAVAHDEPMASLPSSPKEQAASQLGDWPELPPSTTAALAAAAQ